MRETLGINYWLFNTGSEYYINKMREEIDINNWQSSFIGGTDHIYCFLVPITLFIEEKKDYLKLYKQAQVNGTTLQKSMDIFTMSRINQEF